MGRQLAAGVPLAASCRLPPGGADRRLALTTSPYRVLAELDRARQGASGGGPARYPAGGGGDRSGAAFGRLPHHGRGAIRLVAGPAVLAILFALFAGLALVLAAVAIYSLIANTVAERTQELGIRMALGATLRQAMTAVAVPGILLALAGIATGSLLARLTARVIDPLLWGVSPTDLVTFTAAPLLLLGVAAAACLLPVLRVARFDPARTLRQE